MSAILVIEDVIGSSGSLESVESGLAVLSGTINTSGIEKILFQAEVVFPSADNGDVLVEIQSAVENSLGTIIGWDSIAYSQFEIAHYSLNGTADASEANKLHDADGAFIVGLVGRIVSNTTDLTETTVSAFVDSGELTLTDDIFVSGENWIFKTSFKSHLVDATPKYLRVKVTNKDSVAAITTWVNAVLYKQR